MNTGEAEMVAFERECWKAKDWLPALGSALSRLLFLPLLRLRDAARPKHVVVRVLAGVVFYPAYLSAMIIFGAVSLVLLAASPLLFFVGRAMGGRHARWAGR